MGRVLAIDYGAKRTGLAWTDTMKCIATAIGSFPTDQLLSELDVRVKEGPIDCIVLGYPRRFNLEDTHNTQAVLKFSELLRARFPDVKVDLYDERFTSKIAGQAIAEAGISKKKKKEKQLINSVSAVLILQDYLQYTS
jgi:putative Holliday junction resolvase